MSVRIATLIGATGLVGSHLLKLLQKDDYFTTIRVLVRRPFSATNFKTEVKLIDFREPESFKLGIDGSHTVFCAIGTTQQRVKNNREAYRKVDYDIAVNAARFCKQTGCNQYLLVSSVGANKKSGTFYLRLKGEIEEAVEAKNLPSVSIFRPSFLLGNRTEKRTGEKLGQAMMQTFSFMIPGKFKPVEALEVANAMLQASKKETPGFTVYEYKNIKALQTL